jgi:hypothetical protein
MICSPCKGARHSECLNVGRDTVTWCDCQHRAPGAEDVIVVSWIKGPDGVTRKVMIEDVVENVRRPDVQADLAGLQEGVVPAFGARTADDPQEVEGARL